MTLVLTPGTAFESTTSTTTQTTTATISPSAGSTVAVLYSAELANAYTTITCTDSHGNTGTLMKSANGSAGYTAAVFEFYYASAPGTTTYSVAVTGATVTGFGTYILPVVVTGQNTVQTGAVVNSAAVAAKNCEVTCGAAGAGSQIIGVAAYDGNTTNTGTVLSGTSFIGTPWNASAGTYLAAFKSTALTSSATAVNYGFTCSATNEGINGVVAVEILPAPAGAPGSFMPFFI